MMVCHSLHLEPADLQKLLLAGAAPVRFCSPQGCHRDQSSPRPWTHLEPTLSPPWTHPELTLNSPGAHPEPTLSSTHPELTLSPP